MFKVVTDQLKVSQGWVRCGHCAEVFDASKHLLSREASKELSPLAAEPGATTDTSPLADVDAAVISSEAGQVVPIADAIEVAKTVGPSTERKDAFARWGSGKRAEADTAPTALADVVDGVEDFDPAGWKEALQKRQVQEDGAASGLSALDNGTAPAGTPIDFAGLAEDSPPNDEPPRRPDLVRKATVSDAEFEEELDALQQPIAGTEKDVSFVRDAVRKEFWTRPLVRGVLLGFSLVLTLSLSLQWALQQRDRLAASAPRLEAAMQVLCGALGCQIRLPRHVESLVIDSSTFNKIAADAYRLNFVLKNTSNLSVEMPALELTLTDTQDQAVVRRVLLPAEFGVDSGMLGSRAEIAGVVSLRVSGDQRGPAGAQGIAAVSSPLSPNALRVAGYRVLAFYP